MSTQTENFINKVKGGATQLWSVYKVLPSVAIAQAALESAWGTSGLATKYNNLFGIKGSYGGNAANMATWEVYGGVRYDIKANFRAYPNWETSIKDYGVFLNVNSRYKKALGLTSYKAQIKAIHVAGYATDPNYQSKIISIIEANNLIQFDKQVLGVAVAPSKPAAKSIDQLANEVIAGKHGSGDARKKTLGSQFDAVQARVNQLLGAKAVVKAPAKTVQQLVTETLAGKHGNGDARKKSLGSNYNAVMNIINSKTVAKKSVDTIAREVIAGKFGNGADRKKNIEKAGYNYNEVQKRVNQLL